MTTALRTGLLVLPFVLLVAGCGDNTPKQPAAQNSPKQDIKHQGHLTDDPEVKANLAKLSEEDRRLADAQKFCVVEQENRLGAMGVPVKLMVKDQPVFLCCKSCQKKAAADPDKTLAALDDLKKKAP